MEELEAKLREKFCRGEKPSEEEEKFRKVEKVLAPFMRTLKKSRHDKADLLPTAYEDLYLKKNPKELLMRLQKGFVDPLELRTLMNETAELLKVVTKSKRVNLYLVDHDNKEIFLCPKSWQRNNRFQRRYSIDTGTYLAAYVAFTKDYVISSDILGDVRFPLGIPEVSAVKSVICLPIITNTKEKCIGVIELYRECSEKPYDLINLQICCALTAWMGIAVEQNTARLNVLQKLEIQKELSQLAEIYFSGVIPFARTVSDLLNVIKAAVKAERAAFYVFQEPVPPHSESTLFADAYEEGPGDGNETVLYKKNAQARFVKNEPGISGYAARTGQVLNISDAYKDHRFDKKTDSPFFRTRSVAVFPIKTVNGVLAVLHLINSLSHPSFQEEDIDLTESFLHQITMICEYYLVSRTHAQTQLRLEVTESLLEFHTRPSEEELNRLKAHSQGEGQPLPAIFLKFEWEPSNFEGDILALLMQAFLSDILEPCFEVSHLADFLFRLNKSYRPNVYHNFEHGVSVFHFTLNILWRIKRHYSTVETVTLLLAALCHDVDHWGVTNTFLGLQNDTVYRLYGETCGEAHRFQMIMFLIQKTYLLSNFSPQDFTLIYENLEKLIMGFDLTNHFRNRRDITKLLNKDSFSWDDPDHRMLSQNMILICADHSDSFKSFDCVKKSTASFFRELYRQGDLEKSMGFSLLPIMDRTKFEIYPDNGVILLSTIVLPIVEILIRLFPELNVLDELVRKTLKEWTDMLYYKGTPMWRIKDALMKDKKDKRMVPKANNSSILSFIKIALSENKF